MARRAETSGAVGLVVVDSHETFEDDFEMAAEDVKLEPKPKPKRKTSGTDGGDFCCFGFFFALVVSCFFTQVCTPSELVVGVCCFVFDSGTPELAC